jgi:putative ABC transport system substrate-binding protein
MNRRAWLLGWAALCAPWAGAWAQGRRRVVGVLNASNAQGMRPLLVEPVREGLAAAGWQEGRDIDLHFRFAEGQHERLPALLDELMRLQPAVLLAFGPRPVTVIRDANANVPVVAVADNPVETGLAKTLARPGGRFTGVSLTFSGGSILERRLQLLADLVPPPRRFGVLFNPLTAKPEPLRDYLKTLEPALGPVMQVEVSAPADIEPAFAQLARERCNGLSVNADAALFTMRHDLAARCLALKLPSIWGDRNYLDAGGLASFQGDFAAAARRCAALIDKILKGTAPGEIPWEQGTKFELALNLRAAKALGLTIPQRVRLAADVVIE